MWMLTDIFRSQGFMPHGHCYLWKPDILWLHVVSDVAIALAYFSIPAALWVFVKRRRDLAFRWVFVLFIAFIVCCGTTHLLAVWTTWTPQYRAEGLVKAATASVSVATAFALWPLLPRALALPSPQSLRESNMALEREIGQRREAERELRELNSSLEQRVAEHVAALADRERRYRALVDSSQDAILSKTLDGVISSWNLGAERLYGWSEAEVVGKHVSIIIPDEQLGDFENVMARLQRGETVRHFTTRHKRKDGTTVAVSLSVSPILDRAGNIVGASAIARDITAEIRVRDDLERLNAELAQRSEEMEQLVYTVSHDLRSPLVTVEGFSTAAQEDLEEGDAAGAIDALGRIRGAAARMSVLIERILELSRAGRKLEPIELNTREMVGQVLADHEVELERGGVIVDVAEDLAPVYFDPTAFGELVDNLVGNALKYGCPQGQGCIQIRTERVAGRVHFIVQDHGPGVATEHRARIFEIFTRLDASKRGSGLGLAIASKLVHSHRGSIHVQETPGGGATFVVALPASPH